MEIFKLFGSIFVDTTDADEKIEKTDKKGKGFGETLGRGIKKAAEWGAAIVAAASVAGAAILGVANSSAEYADKFDKASLRTGIEVENLQRLEYAASQSGLGLETIEKSAKKLNDRMSELTEGNSKTKDMFDQLGVSVYNADGTMRNSNDVFDDTLMKLAEMGDTAEAASLGTDLFGKAYVDMKPLLAAGADGIQELKDRADELGIVMSGDAVSAGVKFGDTVADIKNVVGGLKNSLGAAVVPILQQFADLIMENMPMIQDMISQLTPVITDLASQLMPVLMDLAQTLLPVIFDLLSQTLPVFSEIISTILPVIVELLQMLLPPILQIVQAVLPIFVQLLQSFLPLLSPLIQLLQPIINLFTMLITPLAELINMILPPLINLFSNIIQSILPGLQAGFNVVSQVIQSALLSAFDSAKTQVEILKTVFQNIIDFVKNVFTGNWQGAWENVKSIFTNIVSGFGNIFKAPINAIISGINTFIKGLNGIQIPDWVPGVGGLNLNIKELPKLKVGLDYVPEDDYPAILHEGEAVLTKEENRAYRQGLLSQKGNYNESRIEYYLQKMIEILGIYFPQFKELMKKEIVMQDGTLVGVLLPEIDRKLAEEEEKRRRGS